MALTPDKDKTAFFYRIRSDPWIQKTLGIVDADDSVATKYILKRRAVSDDELKGNILRILIFNVQSNELRGPYEQSIMQVDVLMGAANQSLADEIQQQIIALCGEGWEVNGKSVAKVVNAGELASAAGFYRCGVRFFYYSCTKTEKRKK